MDLSRRLADRRAPTLRRLSATTAVDRVGRRWRRELRRVRESGLAPVLVLCATAVVTGLALYRFSELPAVALVLPMVVAGQVVAPRTLPWVVAVSLVMLLAAVSSDQRLLDARRIGGVVVVVLVGTFILASSARRARLGVAGSQGESMLVDLRDRIERQATMPALPAHWHAEAVMRSARGASFAGDFIVGSRGRDGRTLQAAVVDVSGKGEQAGSRSLLLSGAFSGLLGALPPEEFLPAANDYLLRQDWSEGFATAVHVSVDLDTGAFTLRSAGHPPGVQLRSGSGRWLVHRTEGPVLGLVAGADFRAVSGTLGRGDTLLLFTDGLVETPSRDVTLGIDRLLGHAEQVLQSGHESGARRLVDRADSPHDDRALLLLHRC
jgi:hypothetical protein